MTKHLKIALAGNANVGKSVIFNQLTGLNQFVGNWPGKTVERAEGTLHYKGYTIHIIDLPGTYSLSAFSMEEIVTRDYIAIEKPDLIINVVDASALERNLYLTLQLLELEAPITIALNQIDLAVKKGVKINVEKLSATLGVPIVPTVAITGSGIDELLSTVIKVLEGEVKINPIKVRYGSEVEERIRQLQKIIEEKTPQISQIYPSRWIAIKLLEKDEDIIGKLKSYVYGEYVIKEAEKLAAELEEIHGEISPVIIASERYSTASKITKEAIIIETPPRISFEQKLDAITTHKILGYPILVGIILSTFTLIFIGGSTLSEILNITLSKISTFFEEWLLNFIPKTAAKMIDRGLIGGLIAGVTIALPYVLPFYVILALLEDTGYLPRAAFLMDNLMHKIGLHGKAFIPLILGYGCTVPACIGCRIMETQRERLIAAFLVTIVPCAARTVVILGLVGAYVGIHAALALYVFNLILIFALGRIAFKVLPGEPIGLIMEMPPYKRPVIKNVLAKTWARTKDFLYIAFPIIIGGSLIITALEVIGILETANSMLAPLITGWLGLPVEAGIPLFFGILRKELAIILLANLIPLNALTATQMIVFALVIMIYTPCIATIAALIRELKWRKAVAIIFIDIIIALTLGGLANILLKMI